MRIRIIELYEKRLSFFSPSSSSSSSCVKLDVKESFIGFL